MGLNKVGGPTSHQAGFIANFKSWLHKLNEKITHFQIKHFGNTQNKQSLKNLDEIEAKIIDIHVRSRALEVSINKKLKELEKSQSTEPGFKVTAKIPLFEDIRMLRREVKTLQTNLTAITIIQHNPHLESIKSNEGSLIESNLKYLDHLEKMLFPE